MQASRDGDTLRLVVRDTGAGLADGAGVASGHSARVRPADGAAGGFGLQQVRGRLLALYGSRAALTLGPAADGRGGTEACVRLPLQRPNRAAVRSSNAH